MMTEKQLRKYHNLLRDCVHACDGLPFGYSTEFMRGQVKRRTTLTAKRLMQKSRELWRLLGEF